MILYGLKTCDTCRKARKALESAGQTVEFQDIRETPLHAAQRAEFIAAFGDALINRASTTWRGLPEEEREKSADALLSAHPALMKRPVIRGESLTLGWKADAQRAHGVGG